MRLWTLVMIGFCFVGCSSEVKLKPTPMSISGKVSQSGQPLGGLMMVFQPLGDGHVREFPLRKDGTFSGELVPGEYAYYLAGRTGIGASKAPRLSAEYFVADMSRTVTVEPDKLLAIALN